MMYIRGHARDYDHWRQTGLTGWGYADVLPYFKKSQSNENGGDAWNGDSGPLHTSPSPPGYPLQRVFVQAAVQAGYPQTSDFNGYQQEGAGMYRLTMRWGVVTALCASVLFALSPLLLTRLAVGHLYLVWTMAVMPWALEDLLQPERSRRRTRKSKLS
jgi:choline dehydrogenase-like flavoprotein